MPFSDFRDEWSGLTLSAALERATQRWGADREAYIFGSNRLTFGEVQADAARVQQALKDAGVGPGDRVAVVMTGVAAWPGVYYGVSAAGAVVVPVNTRLPGREMAVLMRRCGARAIVFHELRRDGVAERVDAALGELVHERVADPSSSSPALSGLRIATFPLAPGDRRDVGDAVVHVALGPLARCGIAAGTFGRIRSAAGVARAAPGQCQGCGCGETRQYLGSVKHCCLLSIDNALSVAF